jgi:cyclic-di-GMP-binding biofilm dispersal mediator protein
MRTPDACIEAVRWATESAPLDVLVNAIGVVAFGPTSELSVDAMEELFLTNTFVPIMLSKAALPAMAPGGTIVQISGVIAEQNLPGMAAYGASKAALRSFNQAFAREARRSNVKVLDTRPPHTETGLADHPIEGTAPKMPRGLSPEQVAARIIEGIVKAESELASETFH